ncbi:MAG: hypothetical protein RL660_136 [Bacteroidota bacterium]|jgi:hypothetical protein
MFTKLKISATKFCLLVSLVFHFTATTVLAQTVKVSYDKRHVRLNAASYKTLDSVCRTLDSCDKFTIIMTWYMGNRKQRKHWELQREVYNYIKSKTSCEPILRYCMYYWYGQDIEIELWTLDTTLPPTHPILR